MTQPTLKLTRKELEDLINNRLETERFEEIFNDIPLYHPDHVPEKGETHRDYIEDDGREYRWLIVKDTVTGVEHWINYTYNSEWPNDVFDVPSSIELVTDDTLSSLYEAPVVVPVAEPTLSPREQADRDLKAQYDAIKAECQVVVPKQKLPVPKARIDEVLNFLKEGKFGIIELRAMVFPICIEYRLEEASFWQWIQVKRGVWKVK